MTPAPHTAPHCTTHHYTLLQHAAKHHAIIRNTPSSMTLYHTHWQWQAASQEHLSKNTGQHGPITASTNLRLQLGHWQLQQVLRQRGSVQSQLLGRRTWLGRWPHHQRLRPGRPRQTAVRLLQL